MKFKRGTTFSFPLDVAQNVNFTGWTGRAQLRTRLGVLVQELTFAWDDPALGTYTLSWQDTNAWPLGALLYDTFLTSPTGAIVGTKTRSVTVVERQTRPVTP
jgi:hypothetical protein